MEKLIGLDEDDAIQLMRALALLRAETVNNNKYHNKAVKLYERIRSLHQEERENQLAKS